MLAFFVLLFWLVLAYFFVVIVANFSTHNILLDKITEFNVSKTHYYAILFISWSLTKRTSLFPKIFSSFTTEPKIRLTIFLHGVKRPINGLYITRKRGGILVPLIFLKNQTIQTNMIFARLKVLYSPTC